MRPFDASRGQQIFTKGQKGGIDHAFIAHFQLLAVAAAAAVVHAASAVTDILTIAGTSALGAKFNELSVLLQTNTSDALAVSKNDVTGVITIKLAMTTATKNTAALIQAAIRALSTVMGVDVSGVTCTAGGNWDTAAKATGEEFAVAFAGGVSESLAASTTGVHAAITDTGTAQVITTGISNPPVPRNITATAGGTAGDIAAVKVTVKGTNYLDEAIEEELPAFTVDTAGTVLGNKAFKTVTEIDVPAHAGTGATTAIGWGDKIGLPYTLPRNNVLYKQTFLDNTVEGTEPTVAVDADNIEGNTIDLNSALNGKQVDTYVLVSSGAADS